jgi:hypothetical protein
MKMTRIGSGALALSLAVSGCASTHLSGTYRPSATNISDVSETDVVAKGGKWYFLWGMLDSGTFDVQEEMEKDLKPYESLVNLEVKDKLSVGGFFLWLITAGIVSHHRVTASGQVALSERPPAPPPPASAPATPGGAPGR